MGGTFLSYFSMHAGSCKAAATSYCKDDINGDIDTPTKGFEP